LSLKLEKTITNNLKKTKKREKTSIKDGEIVETVKEFSPQHQARKKNV
jgi:hypothetical protein